MWIVKKHRRGWAVIKQQVGGHFDGTKAIVAVCRTKAEAQAHALNKPEIVSTAKGGRDE